MHRRQLLTLPALALLAGRPSRAQAPSAPVRTRVETPLGAFVIAVDPARAPVTVANYLTYVDQRWLDGGKVYRIVTPANQPADRPLPILAVRSSP